MILSVILKQIAREIENNVDRARIEKTETAEEREERLINERIKEIKKSEERAKGCCWTVILFVISLMLFSSGHVFLGFMLLISCWAPLMGT